LADAAGIDSFTVGEHDRPDVMDSAGHVMPAAIAGAGHIVSLLGFGPDQLTKQPSRPPRSSRCPLPQPSSASPPPPAAS
jgi:hypothetical protein